MVETQAEGVSLGRFNPFWSSPKAGWLVCAYAVLCFIVAGLVLQRPIQWSSIFILISCSIIFGWYFPKKELAKVFAQEQRGPIPIEILSVVDAIRVECGVSGLRVTWHSDPDFPTVLVNNDKVSVSRRVVSEWEIEPLKWALRHQLKLSASSKSMLTFLIGLFPVLAFLGTATRPPMNSVYAVIGFISILLVFSCGILFERRQKHKALKYAQSFESNTDTATFALSYPYFAQLDGFRDQDRTWVNTDVYERAAKWLGIKLERQDRKEENG